MSAPNDGGPAFPGLHPSQECRFNDPGMTLRDYFAAKALLGMLTLVRDPMTPALLADTITATYAIADLMLAERAK